MTMHVPIRPTAVAGSFYPQEPARLSQMVAGFIDGQQAAPGQPFKNIKALIVPHAGYIFSGTVAASAYSLLTGLAQDIQRVVILGPSHHVAFKGCAASQYDAFDTPLGVVKLDVESIQDLVNSQQIHYLEEAHSSEHCLEVQLPFLQALFDDFLLVPLVVGHSIAQEVAAIMDHFASMPHTLIIISTDLSHFHPYEQAMSIDAHTNQSILNFEHTLVGDQACGCYPLNGLLHWAKLQGLNINNLALKNSGDSVGPKDSVVGYASYVLYE